LNSEANCYQGLRVFLTCILRIRFSVTHARRFSVFFFHHQRITLCACGFAMSGRRRHHRSNAYSLPHPPFSPRSYDGCPSALVAYNTLLAHLTKGPRRRHLDRATTTTTAMTTTHRSVTASVGIRDSNGYRPLRTPDRKSKLARRKPAANKAGWFIDTHVVVTQKPSRPTRIPFWQGDRCRIRRWWRVRGHHTQDGGNK